jgi:hypothetical protein
MEMTKKKALYTKQKVKFIPMLAFHVHSYVLQILSNMPDSTQPPERERSLEC